MAPKEIHLSTVVEEDDIVRVPGVKAGEHVDIVVVSTGTSESPKRRAGFLKGQIWVSPDFDDSLPELEPYM